MRFADNRFLPALLLVGGMSAIAIGSVPGGAQQLDPSQGVQTEVSGQVSWGSANGCVQNIQTNDFGNLTPNATSPTLDAFGASPQTQASTDSEGHKVWVGCVTSNGQLASVVAQGVQNMSSGAAVLPLSGVAIGVSNSPGGQASPQCQISAGQPDAGSCTLPDDGTARSLAGEAPPGTTEIDWQYQLNLPANQPPGAYRGGEVIFTATANAPQSEPANTQPPELSEEQPRDGVTDSVSTGTWTGAPSSYAYQWQRCQNSGTNCLDIAGATTAQYTPSVSDVGKTLRVQVTATNSAGSVAATSATSQEVLQAPANTQAPVLSTNIPLTGESLSVSTGGWEANPQSSYTYKWQRCDEFGSDCVSIAGASEASYTPVEADIGQTLRAQVSAANSAGSASAVSGASEPVAAGTPIDVLAPTLSSTNPLVGTPLDISNGEWTPHSGVHFSYRWERCDQQGDDCTPIPGAEGQQYTPLGADAASTLRGVVIASDQHSSSSPALTAATEVVQGAPFNTAVPTLSSSTPVEGTPVSVTEGAWSGYPSPFSYSYQWLRCSASGQDCVQIAGASSATYTPVAADVTATLVARVSAANSVGQTQAQTAASEVVLALAPINTSPPEITPSAPHQGSPESATSGTWSHNPTSYSYQWRDCDSNGENCADIAGANSSTYTPTEADVGHTLRVTVSASDNGGSATATSAPTTPTIPEAPTNTAPPSLASATPQQTVPDKVSNGTWTDNPTGFTYQWQACDSNKENCVDIPGATSAFYTPVAADVTKTLRAIVTASNSGGQTPAATSISAEVLPQAPVNTALPRISSETPIVGTPETATTGTWTGNPTSYTYQWFDCAAGGGGDCEAIAGAISLTYTPASTDTGHSLIVLVNAANAAGSGMAAVSTYTNVVAEVPSNDVLPSLSSESPTEGVAVSVSRGTWSGYPAPSYTYQWQRCNAFAGDCVNIVGATGSSYTPVGVDVANTIRVFVTASNSAGSASAVTLTSNIVTGAPVNTVAPVLSSSAPVQGTSLSVSNGTWSGYPAPTFTYQWLRCDSSAENCTSISGATGSSYTPTESDVGHELRAQLSASNTLGSSTATSGASAVVLPLPPGNTSPPTIANMTPRQGVLDSVLTGTWTNNPTSYSYQWQRCDTAGSQCVAITGATSSTYTPTAADVADTLVVEVSAANTGGTASTSTAASGPVLPPPPANVLAPEVSPTAAQQGAAEHASTGSWTNSPTSYSYQWQDCDAAGLNCTNIPAASAATYTPTETDVGHTLRVGVTATNSGGSTSQSSIASAVVLPAAPANTVAPSISPSAAQQGVLESAANGTWSNNPTSYSYQWQDCDSHGENCTPIAGASAATYTPVAEDIAHTLRVLVTATNAGGQTAALSTATSVTVPAAPLNTVAPSVSPATPVQGSTETASTGTWSGNPTAYLYQWQRCSSLGTSCVAIAGATASTYTPLASDVGSTLVVQVTASNSGGSNTATSQPSNVVAPLAPVNSSAPVISPSQPQQGLLASTSNGTWSNSPTSFTYQWEDCNGEGKACSAITGATASTYTPVIGDVGHTLIVQVSASNAGGSATSASAHTSSVLAPTGAIGEDSLPISGAPVGITTGPDKNLWFTSPGSDTVTKLTTAGSFTEYKLSTPFSCPIHIASGPDGNLWFTDDCDHQIGKITTAGAPTAFNLTAGVEVQEIVAGPDGNLWFAENGASKIGKITTAGTVTEYALPASSRPHGIAVGGDGNLWFTDEGTSKVGKITTAGSITEFTLTAGSVPYGITAGPDGNIWVTESSANAVVKMSTGGAIIQTYSLPASSKPSGITVGADKNLWFTEMGTGKVARITTAGVITEFALPAKSSSPQGITAGPDGNLWFAESNAIGKISPGPNGAAPVNTAAPTLSSTAPAQGVALSVTNGTWSGSPTSFTYQWEDCNSSGLACSVIAGATSSTYTPVGSDVGQELRGVVIAANSSASAQASSSASSAVLPLAPTNTSPPVISSSTPQQGTAITFTVGSWANSPTSFAYQWQSCNSSGENCTNISGATTSGYTPTAADVGNTLRIQVTASNARGSGSAVSAATNAVLPLAPTASTPAPAVSGSNVEFQTLSSTNGTWGGGAITSYSYQWQRCAGSSCTNIAGATASTYTTTAADVGETIQVIVSATNAAGTASETSAPNGTYVDSSGNANTGSSLGAVANAQAGPFNNAFGVGFNGSANASSSIISLTTPVTSQTNWSLETWLDPSTLSQDGEVIYNGDEPGGNGYGFFVAGASGGDTVGGCLTGLYELITWIDTGYCFPAANQWYYVVETNNQGTVTFYVNGVAVYSGNPGTPGAPAGMMIGGYGGRWFQGGVSNAAFYSSILSASQISSHYAAATSQNAYSAAVLASAPRAYYQLNDWAPIVIAPPTASTPLPAISGSTVEFQTLSATTGTFGGGAGSYTYKWQRCTSSCTTISGATASAYTTTAADVGDTIKVLVTATNTSGSASETSAASSTITLAPPSASTPLTAITGSAVQYGILSASTGTFGGGAVASYSYQWRDCNSLGESCTNISGATASKYTLAETDIGHTIKVVVTATNSAGAASETSARTATVTELPAAGTLVEYSLPASSEPYGITPGPDGNQWFTDEATGKVGKITSSGTITEYTVTSSSPRGITAGPDGNLWFVEHSIREVDHITTSGVLTTFTLTHTSTFNIGIVTGSDENLWFTAETAGFIGKFSTKNELLSEYTLPASSKPFLITAGPDKNLWFTENGTSKIGKLTTAGTLTEYTLPAGSGPFGITAGPDGNLWFTDNTTGKIGKITTAGTVTEFSLPASSKPEGITASPDGNLWFTENGTSKIGRISTAGAITEYALPAGSAPVTIASGNDGYLWFTDYSTSKIGKIAP